MMLSSEEIDNRFNHHILSEEQLETITALRGIFLSLAHKINDYCPPSREVSLALTKLEEAMMHANSAIARHHNTGIL